MEKLLKAKRATRRTWTAKQWKDVVQNVRKMNWGAPPIGGRRERVKLKVKVAKPSTGLGVEGQRIKEEAADIAPAPLAAPPVAPAALGASTTRIEEVAEQVAVTRFNAGVTVHRLLGKGSYGRVYAATLAASGATVATKVMKCVGLGNLAEDQ